MGVYCSFDISGYNSTDIKDAVFISIMSELGPQIAYKILKLENGRRNWRARGNWYNNKEPSASEHRFEADLYA